MYLVVVGELGYGQPFGSVVLTLVHEELEELLNFLINPPCLTVSLQVIGGGGVLLATRGIKLAATVVRSCFFLHVNFFSESAVMWPMCVWAISGGAAG